MIRETNDIYKEVLSILAYCSDNLIEKIPDEVFLRLNELAADSSANFYIDKEKDLDEQDISEESKNLISLIYYNSIANEVEKNELLKIWNENEKKYQEELNKMYGSDNIFKNKVISSTENTPLSNTLLIKSRKKSIFYKIEQFIKKLLKYNK